MALGLGLTFAGPMGAASADECVQWGTVWVDSDWESYEVWECLAYAEWPEPPPENETGDLDPGDLYWPEQEEDPGAGWSSWPPYSDDGWSAQYYAENGFYPGYY